MGWLGLLSWGMKKKGRFVKRQQIDKLWLHSMTGSRPGRFEPRSYRELPCDTSPAGLITVMVPPSSLAPLLQMLDKMNNMTAQSCIEHFRNDDHSCRATCGDPTSGSREGEQ